LALVPDYRVYTLGEDGHIVRRTEIYCLDDEAALERAKNLAEGHAVELWEGDRVIALIAAKTATLRLPLHADAEALALCTRSSPDPVGLVDGAQRARVALQRKKKGLASRPEVNGVCGRRRYIFRYIALLSRICVIFERYFTKGLSWK
jgi:hypothetical protein